MCTGNRLNTIEKVAMSLYCVTAIYCYIVSCSFPPLYCLLFITLLHIIFNNTVLSTLKLSLWFLFRNCLKRCSVFCVGSKILVWIRLYCSKYVTFVSTAIRLFATISPNKLSSLECYRFAAEKYFEPLN